MPTEHRLHAKVRLRLLLVGTMMQDTSPRCAEHGKDGGRRPHLNGIKYLKPVPFIERNILWVGGFKIGRRVVAIARNKGVL